MKTTEPNWPFLDPPNVAVFTSKKILHNGDWIYYVTHDKEDGAWQFHPHSGLTPEDDAAVTSLKNIVNLDESIRKLADLPVGWHAWRETPESKWKRASMKK